MQEGKWSCTKRTRSNIADGKRPQISHYGKYIKQRYTQHEHNVSRRCVSIVVYKRKSRNNCSTARLWQIHSLSKYKGRFSSVCVWFVYNAVYHFTTALWIYGMLFCILLFVKCKLLIHCSEDITVFDWRKWNAILLRLGFKLHLSASNVWRSTNWFLVEF